jgi:hypothetical protein
MSDQTTDDSRQESEKGFLMVIKILWWGFWLWVAWSLFSGLIENWNQPILQGNATLATIACAIGAYWMFWMVLKENSKEIDRLTAENKSLWKAVENLEKSNQR